MEKKPNAFAVYYDESLAVFSDRNRAEYYFREDNICKIAPIYSPHFDQSYKEEEFTAGQEVEVSDDNKNWNKRLFIGEKRNGEFVAEDNKGYTLPYIYCRPIKEKVTYYVYLNKETDTIYTHKEKPTHERFELIHSFTI